MRKQLTDHEHHGWQSHENSENDATKLSGAGDLKQHLAAAAYQPSSDDQKHLIHHDQENVTGRVFCTRQETILGVA